MLYRTLESAPLPNIMFDACCCFCDDLCPYWSGKTNNPRLCMKACTPCHDQQANLNVVPDDSPVQ